MDPEPSRNHGGDLEGPSTDPHGTLGRTIGESKVSDEPRSSEQVGLNATHKTCSHVQVRDASICKEDTPNSASHAKQTHERQHSKLAGLATQATQSMRSNPS